MRNEDNIAVIRRTAEAANRHDPDAWAALFSEDVTNHGQPRGRQGMRAIFRSLLQAFPDWHFEERLIVADGDCVVAEQVMTGTHLGTPELPVLGGLLSGVPPTGKRVSVHHIHIFRLAHSKIVDHQAVRDDLGMMQQLGLIAESAGDVSRLPSAP